MLVDCGTGSFTQGGGDLNLASKSITLDIGVNAGSHGAYYLVGGTVEDDLIVGDAGSGLFSNTGGTNTVNGNLIVGKQSGGVGTYTLGGAGNLTLASNNAEIVLGNDSGMPAAPYSRSTGDVQFQHHFAVDTGTVTFSGTGDQDQCWPERQRCSECGRWRS